MAVLSQSIISVSLPVKLKTNLRMCTIKFESRHRTRIFHKDGLMK